MDRILQALAALLLAGSVLADPPSGAGDSVLGTTRCDRSGVDGLCRIAWDVPATSRAFYWIEEMSPETTSWRRVLGPLSTRSGITEGRVLDGRLYRVVSCEDPTDTQSCVSSTVFWALFQPGSADAIPNSVDDRRGVPMLVSKNTSLRDQKHQYNVYLVRRLMNGVADMGAMPPMTVPRLGSDVSEERLLTEGTEDEVIEHDVYRHYEADRKSVV